MMTFSFVTPALWRLYYRSHRYRYSLVCFAEHHSRSGPRSSLPPLVAKASESATFRGEVSAKNPTFSHSPIETAASKATKPSHTNQKNASDDQEWKEITIDYAKLPHHYLMLSKSRLTSLVVMTSMAGYALAPAPFDLSTFLLCSAGTGLISCSANAINQFFEVPFDSQMDRTKNRVLVRGLLTPLHAVTFATVCALAGISTLYWCVNGLTAALGATNLILYTSIYTPLKRISILNTWVGAVVGAIPPLMGWASCANSLGPGAWIIAGILYAWQFPHFNALSWNLRPDYSRAGYRMMSVTNPGLCRRTALRYTAGILLLSCMAPVFDVTTWWFALESIPLNVYFTYLAWQFNQNSDSKSARKLFRFSLLHLPVLMVIMLINKKQWASKTNNQDENEPMIVPISKQ
ncbi:protoheme IX farnesyltransferase, mitochondrial [Anabrus simplex]|uniref:protoheme IX farnesyltransferase, mitochondrial n=1 Tax=Anabrus simplex TaxID=316456 RepID=UPI0035A2874F